MRFHVVEIILERRFAIPSEPPCLRQPKSPPITALECGPCHIYRLSGIPLAAAASLVSYLVLAESEKTFNMGLGNASNDAKHGPRCFNGLYSSIISRLFRPLTWQLSKNFITFINEEVEVDDTKMMTMVVEENNKPRRRTSTSVSSGNGLVDLACDRDSNKPDHNKPAVVKNKNSKHQQWSAASAVLLLASLLLFALYVSAGRWKGARSHIGDFLAGTSDEPAEIPSLGIVLRPENHRLRDAGIITLHWTITSDFRAPDGVKKKVYLINGNICTSYLLELLSILPRRKLFISSHLSKDTHKSIAQASRGH